MFKNSNTLTMRLFILLFMSLVMPPFISHVSAQGTSSVIGRTVTPNEQLRILKLYQGDPVGLALVDTSGGQVRRVEEGREEALRKRAQQWAAQLAASPVTGIQLDAMGELYVMAGQDAAAQQAFAKRLATPGLSLADRAYTLELATGVFALSGGDSTRIRTALSYMKQLDALPAAANRAKYLGHMSLAYGYYFMGDGSGTVGEALRALALVPDIPFAERPFQLGDGREAGKALTLIGEIWSIDTTKRAKLDSLGQHILSLAQASPDQLANDTRYKSYAMYSRMWTGDIKNAIHHNAMIGQIAPPAVSTHWYNTPAPPPTPHPAAPGAKQLNNGDGKIRVLEFGGLGCSTCLAALPMMERLGARFSSKEVEVWYMTMSNQRWGVTERTPDQSAEHIYKYYVVHHKSKVPMGVWAPPVDDTTTEPGAIVQRPHPSFQAYEFYSIPKFVVIDGKGRVRRITIYSPQIERSLTSLINYLLAEAKRTAAEEAITDMPDLGLVNTPQNTLITASQSTLKNTLR